MEIQIIIITVILWNTIASLFIKRDRLYCGIIAFSGVGSPVGEKLRMLMLYNTLERGKDSTGIYTPSTGITKTIESPVNFLKVNDLVTNDNVFIGHVRSATIGTIKDENAHPFQFGKTILVHNGTLRITYPLLNKMGKTFGDFNVDSEVLCYAIDKYGKDLNFLTEVDGAMALVWTNADEPNTIKCFRNHERPLYYGFIEDNMYISSIEDSLELVGCKKPLQFDTNIIYTITNGKMTKQKLKVKPIYIHHNRNVSIDNQNKHSIHTSILKNRWLQADVNKYFNNKLVFTKGQWYLCVSADKYSEYGITMLGDDNTPCYNSKYCIDFTDFNICKDDYLMCMSTITYSTGGRLFAEEGTVIKCTAIYTDGDLSVMNMKTKDTAALPLRLVRKATKEEVEQYISKISKNCKVKDRVNMKEYVNGILDRINEQVERLKEAHHKGEDITKELQDLENCVDRSYFEEPKIIEIVHD